MTAEQLGMHAVDLRHDHAVAHAKLASTITGFGTTLSATALNERIAQWELETADHHAELLRHSDGHRVARTQYTTTDSNSESQITDAGGGINEAASAVDL